MKPFLVTGTISQNKYNCSYQVCVESSDHGTENMILQEFHPTAGARNQISDQFVKTCRFLTDLSRSFAKEHIPEFWTYTRADGTGYILFGADYTCRLNEEERCGSSTWERLTFIWNVALALDLLARDNVLLNQTEAFNILCPEEGSIRFWNFDSAVYADERCPDTSVCNQARHADIVSLACLLYSSITQEKLLLSDLENTDFIENQLAANVIALCDELTVPDLQLLLQIFRKSLCADDGYEDISEMVQDLELLLDRISVSSHAPDANQDVELAAADFLDRTPLYRYAHAGKSESTLNVVMIGNAPIRSAFFNTIFSTAQMLDTRLRIHVMAADADAFYSECVRTAPLLPRSARISHIPERTDAPNVPDPHIIGDLPLADLVFETTADIPTARQLRRLNPSCILLLGIYTEEMSRLVQELAKQTQKPLLVGIGTHKSLECSGIGKNGNVDLRFFSRSGACVGINSLKETAIYQKALAIHTFYEKNSNERVSRKTIMKGFRNSYNRSSSLRNALAIPYKLSGCGLADQTNVSRQFFDKVLSPQGNQMLLRRLIWLEHRSWQAFVIINGYQLPPEDQQAAFFLSRNYNHQDRNKKIHLCLCASRDEGIPLPLSQWTLEDWEKRETDGLDPLDQLSVTLHRVLAAEVEKRTAKRLHDMQDLLKNKLSPDNASLYQECCITLDHLLNRETNSHLAWKRVHAKLLEKLPGDNITAALDDLADIVIKRNQYRDFKQSDLSTIEAIPYLLLDNPVRRVYKLYSDHLWDNVASSVFIEPEELVVITDSTIDGDQFACFERFLHERRNLDVKLRQINLRRLRTVKPDGVLDITGATAHQILDAQQHPLLSQLPVVEYRNGKLINPDRKYSQIQFYNCSRSLTVSEMLSLTGATMLSDQEDIPMLGMDKYDKLWKLAQKYPHYNNACTILSDSVIKEKSIYQGSTCWVTYLSRADAEGCGLIDLLNQLRQNRILAPFTWGALHGATAIAAADPLMQRGLDIMLDKAVKKIQQNTGAARCTFAVTTKPDFKTGGIFACDISCNNEKLGTVYKTPLWETKLQKSQADQNGLSALLDQLVSISIIKPFKWKTDGQKTQIRAADPYCQQSLNEMLDFYINPDKANQSDLKLLFRRDEQDHAKTTVSLVDTSLKYRRKIGTSKWLTAENSGAAISVREFVSLLTDLRNEGILKTAAGKPIHRSPDSAESVIEFEYADIACRDCLTKEGNVLEAFAYHTIRRMNLFDDVKLSVTIRWDKQGVEASDTSNEIDIICTKGTKSYFISCKKRTAIGQEHLTEIRYEADRFGVDSIPILLATAREDKKNIQIQHNRAKRMGIEIITLQDFTPELGTAQDSAKVLTERLTAIVSGT